MDLVSILKRVDEFFTGMPYEERREKREKQKQSNNKNFISSPNNDNYSIKRFYIKNHEINYLRKLKIDIDNLLKRKMELNDALKLIDESINDKNRQILLNEVTQLEKEKERLSKSNKKLNERINKLSFQKEMLQSEIEVLEEKKGGIFMSDTNNISLSIEYIDNLTNGLDFEKYFAFILEKLHYTDIEVTDSSGDYGIDVLATKDDILYGFQCKLYSAPVGNEAIQEAYSGKQHYNCNIAVVVTNSDFTEQAKLQAMETQVILWNRKVLIKKLKEINKNR